MSSRRLIASRRASRSSAARSAGTSTSKPRSGSRTTRTAEPGRAGVGDVAAERAGAVGEAERRRRPGPRARACRRRGGRGRRRRSGGRRRPRSARATGRRTRQVGVGDDRRGPGPCSAHQRDAGGRGAVEATRVVDDASTPWRARPRAHVVGATRPRRPGSVAGRGEHLVGHPLGRARRAARRRACSARRALPTRERPDRDHDARARSRDGSGTMSLRMLPTVDAMYVVARVGAVPAAALRACGGRSRARRLIPVRGPVILASNHVSYLDPLVARVPRRPAPPAGAVPRQGRAVREAGCSGRCCARADQIPVQRGTATRPSSLDAAVDALAARRVRRPCSPRARSRSTSSRWRASRAPRGSRRRAGCRSRRSGSGARTGSCSRGASRRGGPGVAETVVVGEPVRIAPDEDVPRRDRPDHGGDLRRRSRGPRDLPAARPRPGDDGWWVRAPGDRAAAQLHRAERARREGRGDRRRLVGHHGRGDRGANAPTVLWARDPSSPSGSTRAHENADYLAGDRAARGARARPPSLDEACDGADVVVHGRPVARASAPCWPTPRPSIARRRRGHQPLEGRRAGDRCCA